MADMERSDAQRQISTLFLKQLAVYAAAKNQTVWEIAQDFNWMDWEAFRAKFEPLRAQYEVLLQAANKKRTRGADRRQKQL